MSFCLAAVQPQVVAYKKSEHGNEGDTGVLTCKSLSYPPVGTWLWFRSDQTVSAVVCWFVAPLPSPLLLTNRKAEGQN